MNGYSPDRRPQQLAQMLAAQERNTSLGAPPGQRDMAMRQVPGKHYNFVKKEFYEVDEETGLRNFYTQLLTGDTSDNIKGIAGIGPVKAKKALTYCFTEQGMFTVVREMYNNDEWMKMNGQCLYILRSLEDSYLHHFERLSNGE